MSRIIGRRLLVAVSVGALALAGAVAPAGAADTTTTAVSNDCQPGDPPDAVGADGQLCFDTDADLVPDSFDTCPDTAPGATVDASGCEVVEPEPVDPGPKPDDPDPNFQTVDVTIQCDVTDEFPGGLITETEQIKSDFYDLSADGTQWVLVEGTWTNTGEVYRYEATEDDCPANYDPDGDGFTTGEEESAGSNPNDPSSTPEDVDGDGVPNGEDAFPSDPNESADSDGDGVGDNADAFPTDPNESSDSDGDGFGNNEETEAGSDPNNASSTPNDVDGDGVPNGEDAFPSDPNDSVDSDGDGFGDNKEAEVGSDPNNPSSTPDDIDGDGFGNDVDQCDDTPGGATVDPNGCEIPEGANVVWWDGDASTNKADPACQVGGKSKWSWNLAGSKLLSGVLNVTYVSGATSTTEGTFTGNEAGAMRFDVTRPGPDVVQSAWVLVTSEEPKGNGQGQDKDGNFVLNLVTSSCEPPPPPPAPTYEWSVASNEGTCEVNVPTSTVTTAFGASLGHQVVGQDMVWTNVEVGPGQYVVELPGLSPGGSVKYKVLVSPLDDTLKKPLESEWITFNVPQAVDCGVIDVSQPELEPEPEVVPEVVEPDTEGAPEPELVVVPAVQSTDPEPQPEVTVDETEPVVNEVPAPSPRVFEVPQGDPVGTFDDTVASETSATDEVVVDPVEETAASEGDDSDRIDTPAEVVEAMGEVPERAGPWGFLLAAAIVGIVAVIGIGSVAFLGRRRAA